MKKRLLLVLGFLFIFVACSSSPSSESSYDSSDQINYEDAVDGADQTYEEASEEASSESIQDETNDVQGQSRKLIVSYDIFSSSTDYDAVVEDVKKLVQSYDGYSMSLSESSSAPRSLDVLLRIPADLADKFVDELSNIENLTITEKDKFSEDLTSTYFDSETRLTSLRSKLSRLEETKAQQGDIDDLLRVEEEISSTIHQIEQIESSLKNYDQLADYTEINLHISEITANKEVTIEEAKFTERLSSAFTSTLRDTKYMIQNIILTIIVLLPRLLVLGLLIFIIYKIVKFVINRYRQRSNKNGKKKNYYDYEDDYDIENDNDEEE